MMSDDSQDITEHDVVETLDISNLSPSRPLFRIIDGGCPALECELPQNTILTVKTNSFMAKSNAISIDSSSQPGFELYQNDAEEPELLYLTNQMAGSFMMFDLSVHRHGLIILADSLFAYDEDVVCETVLDVEIGEAQKRGYKLYQVTGEGQVIAFMGGDLFPLSLGKDDHQQVHADMIAAFEPSIGFELAQLGNGQYVASLSGAGRIWLQSIAQYQPAEIKPSRARAKGGFFTR